jgi:GNAT superfamily N-acetyltransferase
MSFYYNSNQICFQKIDINWAFVDIYKELFPETVPDDTTNLNSWKQIMNGCYGSNAIWYALFSCAGEPYDWSHLLAFCTIGGNGHFYLLYNFAVLKDYQRMGYGSQLLDNVIKQFDSSRNVYLFVKKTNRIAIRLYRKYNFEYDDQTFMPPYGQICLVKYNDNCDPKQNLGHKAVGLLKKSDSPI